MLCCCAALSHKHISPTSGSGAPIYLRVRYGHDCSLDAYLLSCSRGQANRTGLCSADAVFLCCFGLDVEGRVGEMPKKAKIPPGLLVPNPTRRDDGCCNLASGQDHRSRTSSPVTREPSSSKDFQPSRQRRFAHPSTLACSMKGISPGGAPTCSRTASSSSSSFNTHNVLVPAAANPRKDHPVRISGGRSSLQAGLDALGSEAATCSALAVLRRDYRANSSRASTDSLLRTWVKLAEAACVGDEIWPLSPGLVEKVAAAFKAGRYRSFANYVSRAKQYHITLGHVWTDALDLMVRQCVRSCARGLGPGKQSKALDIALICSRSWDMDPLVSGGPIGMPSLVVLAVFHLLREVEVSYAMMAHLTLDEAQQRETLHLPVSKTDPQALGCQRSWRCVCESGSSFATSLCPYHAAKRQLDELRARFPESDPLSLPLFPDATGGTVSKKLVISSLRRMASLAGSFDSAELSESDITGHTFRVTGAQFLASKGLDINLIMLLARWTSPIVMHYAQEAPLNRLSETYLRLCKDNVQGTNSTDLETLKVNVSSLLKDVRDLRAVGIGMQSMNPAKAEGDSGLGCVLNVTSKTLHKVLVLGEAEPCNWRTICGWRFASGRFRFIASSCAAYRLCNKCEADTGSRSSFSTHSDSSSAASSGS